jgi:hypothetical protein
MSPRADAKEERVEGSAPEWYSLRDAVGAGTLASYNRFVSNGDYTNAVRVADAAWRHYVRTRVGPHAELRLKVGPVAYLVLSAANLYTCLMLVCRPCIV